MEISGVYSRTQEVASFGYSSASIDYGLEPICFQTSILERVSHVFASVIDRVLNQGFGKWFLRHRPDVVVLKSLEMGFSFKKALDARLPKEVLDTTPQIIKDIETGLSHSFFMRKTSSGLDCLPVVAGVLALYSTGNCLVETITEGRVENKFEYAFGAMDGLGNLCKQIVSVATIIEKVKVSSAISEGMSLLEKTQIANATKEFFKWTNYLAAVGIGLSSASIALEFKRWWELSDFNHQIFSNEEQGVLEGTRIACANVFDKLLQLKDEDLQKYFSISNGKKFRQRIIDTLFAAKASSDPYAMELELKRKVNTLKNRVSTLKEYQPWVILAGVISWIASVLFLLSFATPVGYVMTGVAALIIILKTIHHQIDTYKFKNEWGLRETRYRKLLPTRLVKKLGLTPLKSEKDLKPVVHNELLAFDF